MWRLLDSCDMNAGWLWDELRYLWDDCEMSVKLLSDVCDMTVRYLLYHCYMSVNWWFYDEKYDCKKSNCMSVSECVRT